MMTMKYLENNDGNFSYKKITNRRMVMKDVHFHNDYELYYLLDGTIKYFIGDEIFFVRKGNFVFVPKGVLHKTDSEDCLRNERMLVCFDDSLFNDDEMKDVLNELSEAKLICVDKNRISLVTDVLQKIQKEHSREYTHKDAMIKTYTRELLILLCRYRVAEEREPNDADRLIYKISEYISNNFPEDIGLKRLAFEFAISEAQLSRRFKTVVGMGVSEYIRYVRILNAESLLKSTTLSITEVAEKCGFNDSNYFSTVFKLAMGTTPVKYRKMSSNTAKDEI